MPRRGDCRDEKRIFLRQQAAYMLYAAVWRVFGASLQVGTKVRGHTPNPEQPANQAGLLRGGGFLDHSVRILLCILLCAWVDRKLSCSSSGDGWENRVKLGPPLPSSACRHLSPDKRKVRLIHRPARKWPLSVLREILSKQ